MKRILLILLAVGLFLSGCGNSDTQGGNSAPYEDENYTKTEYEIIENIDPVIVDSPEYNGNTASYENANREVLANSNDLKTDTLSLPDIEQFTQEQLDKSIKSDGIKLSMSSDVSHLGEGAKKAIKMEFVQNVTWDQVVLAYKLDKPLANGLTEGILLDPVPESLEAYQGIRFYVDLNRPEGREYSICKLRFMFGSFSNYRSIYEYSCIMPDGDYKGYIDIPFNEMKNGYNQKIGASVTKIDYFGFNVSLEGSVEGMEVYVSDFQAYREMFW